VDLAFELLGLDLALSSLDRAEPHDMVEGGHEFSALGRRQPELGDACRQLFSRRRRTILRRDVVSTAQDRTERAEVPFAERRARRPPHHDRAEPLIILDPRQEFAHQPRLANAGIADQPHYMGVARERPFQTIENAAELGVAADQGGAQSKRLEPAGFARGVERTNQAVHRMLAALALERDLAHGLKAERMAGEAVSGRANQYLTGSRQGLQTLRRVHRVAGDGVGLRTARAEAASHHRPRVDAEVERERQASAPAPVGIEARRPFKHSERRPKCPLGVVLMGVRRAEQREQGIADELVHEAAELLHRSGQFFEQLVLERLHDLGVELFGECRESAEVRKQDGDGAPVSLACKGRYGGQ
jgi:hypothetical protein